MKETKIYEPPMMKVYPFDDESILTASSGSGSGSGSSGGGGTPGDPTNPVNPTANYAANALNQFMGGTNTTIEK